MEELKEEIEEEKEAADTALLAKRQLEKEKLQLEDQLDVEVIKRQEEAKQKQNILQEKETLVQSLQDLKKVTYNSKVLPKIYRTQNAKSQSFNPNWNKKKVRK
jgi:dsDNA-specific endonuclease/ATPase MutS2